jgi:hypothetical protein
VFPPLAKTSDQSFYRLRLVSLWLEIGNQPESPFFSVAYHRRKRYQDQCGATSALLARIALSVKGVDVAALIDQSGFIAGLLQKP